MAIRVQQPPIIETKKMQTSGLKTQATAQEHGGFKALLDRQLLNQTSELKFSAHAQQRLEQRNIKLNPEDVDKMKYALNELEKKGGRNTVMFFKETAFIANVGNRTIITAIPVQDEINILTQIDSAVTIK